MNTFWNCDIFLRLRTHALKPHSTIILWLFPMKIPPHHSTANVEQLSHKEGQQTSGTLCDIVRWCHDHGMSLFGVKVGCIMLQTQQHSGKFLWALISPQGCFDNIMRPSNTINVTNIMKIIELINILQFWFKKINDISHFTNLDQQKNFFLWRAGEI